ncbi:hypothetical protein ACJIZ3_020889 [Penstemon smallii]|uniref:Transmembrane protein n=1 Tax=Penstemon smallii TaxID=265156 RepID=A0ABD3SKH3_9LAMI
MAAKMIFGSSFSCVPTYLCSPFQGNPKLKLSSTLGLFDSQLHREHLVMNKVVKSCRFKHAKLTVKEMLLKRQCILFAASDDQLSNSEFEADDFELEKQHLSAEDDSSTNISHNHIEGAGGKPGFISFYGHAKRIEDDIRVSSPQKEHNVLLWFTGPTVLVASFVFPSIYLRRIISTIFEDSLLTGKQTDFLILFFTEALFYCGVAVFLLLIDRMLRPIKPVISGVIDTDLTSHLGHRISSVAVLVLSVIIPTVTMGLVWPWTGPAASATLAPYLVGIVVQFAFEQYTKHIKSPSWPAIPIIFQVYRLHQLNRAAQLVTALSFTVRGAEMTPHNLAINASLSTLLNVLQFLGVISIWSLSSFIMKYFPSVSTSEH